LPDGATLPAGQPAEIAASITVGVTLTSAQAAAIRAASPHVRLVNHGVRDKIAERYSTSDEIKMLRLSPSAESAAYNAYVETCRQWGQAQRRALGLS
jgi:hypothetical protein